MLKWVLIYLVCLAFVILFFMGAYRNDDYKPDDIDDDPPLGI